MEMRGGFRGRGGAPIMRGRGRGGMGRGGPGGMRGGMSTPPMRGRGGYLRGNGGPPRGSGGPQMRGRGGAPVRGAGRPAVHAQLTTVPTEEEDSNGTATTTASTGAPASTTQTNGSSGTTTQQQSAPVSYRGTPRGRGAPRGSGRGGYISNSNGNINTVNSVGAPGEHNKVLTRPYRGGPPRARGGYSQSPNIRPPLSHTANTQVAPVPTLKRGAPIGPPGPKRGRYEQPSMTRPMPSKYHHSTVQTLNPQHGGYGQQTIPSHHSGYQNHETMQHDEHYSHQYSSVPSSSYNGYNQSGYGQSTGYAQPEYDHSQYQGYSNTGYGQDTRYQGYTQDYSQSYGASTVDYNAAPPDYSQQQSYDDRSYYGKYSYPQAYQQGYTGYY